jgi:glycosyltransferase involved in cell wall biosynthesis
MRILMLTSSVPYPPQQGGALRAFGILRGLYEQGHEITLLSFADETENSANGNDSPLPGYCKQIETIPTPQRSKIQRLRDVLLTSRADIARRLESAEMRQRLQRLLVSGDHDLVQFEGIEMAIYLPFAREIIRQNGLRAKLCYDSFNAEYALQRIIAQVEGRNLRRLPAAIYSRIQSQRIYRFEKLICETADFVIAVSSEDAEAMRELRRDGQIYVLPSGIYAKDYAEHPQRLDLGDHVLVFTGKMDYRPNVDAMLWFANSVMPQIQAKIPDVKLYIVGQKPHRALQSLREKESIEVTGWVTDIQPYLHAASTYVAPLRMGSGTRLKILEAMAAGCAVVATTIGASGLTKETREAMVLADTEQDQANAVIRLLDNSAERTALGAKAQEYARKYYDWSVLIPCLLDIYLKQGLGS